MHVAAAVLATILVILLVIVQPLRGKQRYAMLVDQLRADPHARMRFYVRGIVAEWVAVALVGLIGVLDSRGPSSIRLTWHVSHSGASVMALLYAVLLVLSVAASTVVFRRSGPETVNRLRKQVRGFVELLPRTVDERRTFAAVAVTAGVCEEILYRGFGIAYLKWVLPGANSFAVILLIGVAFGTAHSYQGRRGVLLTGLLGALLAWLTILTGTLLPAIVVHIAIDLRSALLPVSISEPYQPTDPEPDPTHRQ